MPKKPASASRPDPRRMLEQAFALHRQNRLGEAEPLYVAVLRQKPDDFDALHLLGLLNMDYGRLPEALRLIGAALRTNGRSGGRAAPTTASCCSNSGAARRHSPPTIRRSR